MSWNVFSKSKPGAADPSPLSPQAALTKARAYFEGAATPPATPKEAPWPVFAGDPLGRLPPLARQKFQQISDAADDSRAPLNALSDEISELRLELHRKRARRSGLLRGEHGLALRSGDPAILRVDEEVADAERELARLQSRYDARAASWQEHAVVRDALRSYIKTLRSARIELAPAVEVKIGKEPISDALGKVRSKLERLQSDLRAVDAAVYPSADCKAAARKQIEQLAERGKPDVLSAIEGGGDIEFARMPLTARDARRSPDALALVCWLHKDELLSRVEREIDANSDDANALTDAERETKRIDIASAILEQERQEEELVVMAAEQGVIVPRRRDCDPRAVLGLSDAMPAPKV